MKSFYLKNQKGKYCILGHTQVEMEAMCLVEIYTKKFKQTLPEDVQDAVNELTQYKGFWDKKNYWNNGKTSTYTSFFIDIISFKQVPLKNSSHDTTAYSLTQVKDNYNNLLTLQKNYQIITQFLLGQKSHFEPLMPNDIKEYIPYRANEFDLNKPYFKQQKFNSFLKPCFDTLIKSWQTVVDEQGHALDVEDNNFASKFNEKEGYALFCNDQYSTDVKNSGFWGSTNSSLTDINQAKLFQSETHAERYVKSGGFKNIAIVRVNVKFDQVVKQYGHINVLPLEAAKAEQEKAYLDNLMTNTEEIKSLATKLLSAVAEEDTVLKEALKKLIEKQNNLEQIKENTAKPKKKI
jgi:hypothetical protein